VPAQAVITLGRPASKMSYLLCAKLNLKHISEVPFNPKLRYRGTGVLCWAGHKTLWHNKCGCWL